MKIEEKFERWIKEPLSENESEFASKQPPDDYYYALGFYGGYNFRQPEIDRLIKALKGLLIDADESWCTCGADAGEFVLCGCYYHDALEALKESE